MIQLLMTFPLMLAAKASVLFVVGFGITSLLRHTGAEVRHRIWLVTFGGALALPLLMAALPRWEIVAVPARSPTADVRGAIPGGDPEFALPQTANVQTLSSPDGARLRTVATASAGPKHASPHGSLLSGSAGHLFGLWISGALAVLFWAAWGIGRLAQIRRRAHPVTDPQILQELQRLTRTAGVVNRPVRLVQTDALRVPGTWGFLRPLILVPTVVVQGPSTERRTVLLHELLHIRRGAWLGQLMALAGCAFYWFHPLAWLARTRLRTEEEFAVDEEMVRAGMRRTDYSEQLVRVVHLLRGELRPIAGTVPFMRRSSLEARLRKLLGRSGLPARLALRVQLAISALLVLAVLVVAASDVGSRTAAGQVDLVPVRTLDHVGHVLDATLLPGGRVAVLEGTARWTLRVLDAKGKLIASSPVEPYWADALVPYGQDGLAVASRGRGRLNLHRVTPAGLEVLRLLELPVRFHDACWMDGRFYVVDEPAPGDWESGRALRSLVRVVDEEGRLVGSLAPLPPGVERLAEIPHRDARIACIPEHGLVVVQPVFFSEVTAWSREGELRWRAELPGFRALDITGERSWVRYAHAEGQAAWHPEWRQP